MAEPPPPAAPRLPEFDLLRAAGALLGIALHSAIPYMNGSVPELLWAAHDSRTAAIFDWVFWWLRALQVPLFLLVSGFFAAARLSQGDPAGFLRGRCRRLALPFAAGLVLVLPLMFAVWARGWVITGRSTWYEIHRLRFSGDISRNLWGPAHLWFLEDLFLISVAAALAWAGILALRKKGAVAPFLRFLEKIASSRWGILPVVACTVAVLSLQVGTVTAHRNTFLPLPWRVAYCASIFAGGLWLYRFRRVLPALASGAWLLLAVAAVPLAVALRIMGESGSEPPLLTSRLALAACFASVTWLSLAGMVGLGWRFREAGGRVIRMLSADAYWIYVVHLPIVGALQLALLRADWPAAVKFPIVFTGTVIASAASGAAVRRMLQRRGA